MLKTRLIIFSTLFIIFSGLIGAWLVPTRLLYGFGFYLYANLGKLVLIGMVVLGLLFDRLRPRFVTMTPLIRYNYIFLVATLPLSALFYYQARILLQASSLTGSIYLTISTHLALVTIPISLLIGCFGTTFLIAFIRSFSRELIAAAFITVLYDVAIFQIWKLWPLFSGTVLVMVRSIAQLFTSHVSVVYPRTLYVNGFGVEIGESCSGLDSLFMFITLSIVMAAIEWRHLNKSIFLRSFIPSLIGLYLVNILRVLILVLIGGFVSPILATQLFHTYLGMVLFIIYFFLYWKFIYKHSGKNL